MRVSKGSQISENVLQEFACLSDSPERRELDQSNYLDVTRLINESTFRTLGRVG